MGGSPRKRTKGTRGADTAFGYLIPGFLIILASYQQINTGAVDRYVLTALVIFGLGALGWRLDVLFEAYMRARYGGAEDAANQKRNTSGVKDDENSTR